MEPIRYTALVYTPRFGAPTHYTITFNSEGITIDHGHPSESLRCRFPEDKDPVWEGHNQGNDKNPLMSMFRKNKIYVSSVVHLAMEEAWRRWQDEVVTSEVVLAGLQDLFAWIDQTARSKPKSELWDGIF